MSEDTSDANATAKSYGHRRQPALGKAMPVTALLLNMPKSNELRAGHMRGGGGGEYATDEHDNSYEQPPRFFDVDECTDDKDCEEINDAESRLEQAFELLVSECSSSSGSEHETVAHRLQNAHEADNNDNDNNKEDGGHALAGEEKDNAYKPCLRCTHNAPGNLAMRDSAINEMCQRLCTDECRLRLSLAGFVPPTSCGTYSNSLSTPPLTTIPRQPPLILQRKKFLTNALTTASDTSDSDFSASADANVTTAAAPLTQQELHAAIMLDLFNKSGSSSPLPPPAHDLTAFKDLREKYDEVAEALVKTSAMTSTSRMRQRLAARKLEIEIDLENAGISDDVDVDVAGGSRLGVADVKRAGNVDVESSLHALTNAAEYVPPRDLLLYLVRMGSFNSAPRINNVDTEDDNFELPQDLSMAELLQHVRELHGVEQPPLLKRRFLRQQTFPLSSASASSAAEETTSLGDDISDGLRCLDLGKVSQYVRSGGLQNQIRIIQWNILSQTLGQHNDGFVCCPESALTWQNRKFLIVQEILQTQPDVVCLQEVDHFKFLEKVLATQQYEGIFFPKPDSPCLYIDDNNGPDGCAIFYRRDKLKLKQFETRILEVWRVQSNQVAIALMLEVLATGREFCVCTTHLKARKGSLLAKLRNEQGRDLIRFVKNFAGDQPVLLCGDFNAEPIEPIYTTILNCDILNLGSAYADMKLDTEECLSIDKSKNNGVDFVEVSMKREPVYTTWKIREQGEECHTIDYVFYTREHFKVKNCLDFPQPKEIGENRTPSHQYPSDHFSLVCDFEFLPPLAEHSSQASQSSRLHV